MKYRFILLVLCIMGFVIPAAVSAQSSPDELGFSFWMVTQKGLWKYDHKGNLLDSVLRAEPDDQLYDESVHVSEDGRLIGFIDGKVQRTLTYSAGGGTAWTMEWFNWKVVDTETDTLLYEDQPKFNMTGNIGGAFSADHSTVVYSGFDTRKVDWYWQIIVADLTTGSQTATLDSNTLETTVLSAEHYYNNIEILSIDGSNVTFTIGTYKQIETYTWDYASGDITQHDTPIPVDQIRADRSIYDETIYPAIDERFPFKEDTWDTFNTLYAITPYQADPFPFYTSSTYSPINVRFMQNDERIAVNYEQGYILLERDGTVVATTLPYNNWDTSTPDGYLFIKYSNFSSLSAGVYSVNTRGDEFDVNLIITMEELSEAMGEGYGQFVWVESHPSTTVQELQPLVSPEPDQLGLHHVAYINTTEGDTLNVRTEPSTSAEVVYHAANNERAMLVDGPVESEGFVWWKLKFTDGTTGWAVETIPGEMDTLYLPTGDQSQPILPTEAGLAVGKTALIVNDAVNVRVAAGTDKQVEEVLARNSVVTVISGPEEVDGLRWWRVETVTGNQGWVIEATSDGIIILQATE